MAMQQNLSMGLSQHLVMTAQMQQAVQILQLSSTELSALVEREFLENPALELDYADVGEAQQQEMPDNARAFADYLGDDDLSPRFSRLEERRPDVADEAGRSLEEELLEQARFAFADECDRAIAVFLVGSTDENGYLTVSVEEAARVSQTDAAHVRRVLRVYQTFEPAGVGARDLAECLRIQAKAQGIYEGLVAHLIDAHLAALADAKIREIAAAEGCSPQEVQQAADIVRRLDPKPGRAYGGRTAERIVPDIVVRRTNGGAGYVVELTDARVPHLCIAQAYRETDGFDEATRSYIQKRLSAASWLITSIEQRRTTIRRVVEAILRAQQDYLAHGETALRPMTMKQIAEATELHESTVSRAVANKYIELPHGTMPLRRLFSANLSASAKEGKATDAENMGKGHTAAAAKAAIRQAIETEDAHHPLSDQKICTLLTGQGFAVSRRTVMKYREQLGYPSSTRRRRY